MKRCPQCGVQDHDEAILCKSCMRSFASPPERKAGVQTQRKGSPLRLILSFLVFGAIAFAVTNPDLALQLVSDVVQRITEARAGMADADPPPRDAVPVAAAVAPAAAEQAAEPAAVADRAAEERASEPAASPRAAARRAEPRPAAAREAGERPAEPARTDRAATAPPPSPPPVSTPPPSPAPSQPLRVGGNIRAPAKVRDVRPVYPAIAQASKVQGIVVIEATIGPDGRVRDTRVLRSTPLLDDAALEAVRQWQYEPTLLNGEPVPVIMTVTVSFRLQ
jgi:periplasmic protein TonB